MDVLAIITARGGSKRLPGKNIRELCGKPLIAWTIEAAKNCNRIVVTTDSEEIASVSSDYGAEVIMRPQYLSTDSATSIDTVIHAVKKIRSMGYSPKYTMLLQPTSPLRTKEDIVEAYGFMQLEGADNIVSVNPDGETNGAIYLCKASYWLEHYTFDGPNTAYYKMPEEKSVDIDTIEDFKLAEKYLRIKPT